MPKYADHDAYIVAAPADLRPMLALLRTRLPEALPDTEELVLYDMPGFGFGKTVIAGYAAFTKQCGLYVSSSAIAAHATEIAYAAECAARPPSPVTCGSRLAAHLRMI